jgi:hypothetical protein
MLVLSSSYLFFRDFLPVKWIFHVTENGSLTSPFQMEFFDGAERMGPIGCNLAIRRYPSISPAGHRTGVELRLWLGSLENPRKSM